MGIHFYKRINPSICPSQSYLVFELIAVIEVRWRPIHYLQNCPRDAFHVSGNMRHGKEKENANL